MSHDVLVIAGPTGSGKSSLALKAARVLGGVVINADSVQIYDALPIITAQPTADDYQAAPHRLYAYLSPADTCSAEQWRDMAVKEIRAAHHNGKLPIIAGGSGFYITALLEGFSPIPEVPADIREESRTLQQKLGNPAFHTELKKKDPEMASRLDPNDTQRLIRAWEVLEASGKSMAHWQSLPKSGPPVGLRFYKTMVNLPRAVLYNRINRRFEEMHDLGALEEVKNFRASIESGTIPEETPLLKAHGYLQYLDYLSGQKTLHEAIAASQQITRNYAKRQMTWLKHQYNADETLTNVEKFAESVDNWKTVFSGIGDNGNNEFGDQKRDQTQ